MIRPEDFYRSDEAPSARQRNRIWRVIQQQRGHGESLVISDRRSFLFGMAASLVMGLAFYGGWTILRQGFESAKPAPLRLEQAYVSAIREFEKIVPAVSNQQKPTTQIADQLTQRREQVKLIDVAISDLRLRTNGTDLSPLTRDRLRRLYSMKLQILQQMIEEGEIEL